MFVAWRDLRFAKGRFVLMGTVIVLITVLVGLLSGLTAGLGQQNISAITGLRADKIAFGAPADGQERSFSDSSVSERQWRQWARTPGVKQAEPLGITTTRAESGKRSAAISAFGIRSGSGLGPEDTRVAAGSVVLSQTAAEELGDAKSGSRVTIAGRHLSVAAVAGDAFYSHTPVIWTSLADWQQLGGGGGAGQGPSTGDGERAGGDRATVIALSTGSGSAGTAEVSGTDTELGTETVSRDDALSAIGSYTSENGSLQLMRGFLFVISALVIGAFFTVWTIQRSADVAVLKALGASTPYLLRDALGQAVVLLTLGTATGTGIASGVGALVSGTVPFVLDAGTVLLPAAVLIVLGAAGAALAIRRITAVDPLTALGSAR
ncbi:ABC transporter permease [Streptomyces iconiensis]|uniref:ABC transporter permease n=1 Tax=Streptomyces iconiensis TaxID=1384038 RepID=A0ABT6ZUR0_9ACTN|nr:ABC transporter permease [Streptomyces iconiensis]MDJ1132597.1 ABC transporter permease [Streptomyces iconiensis]